MEFGKSYCVFDDHIQVPWQTLYDAVTRLYPDLAHPTFKQVMRRQDFQAELVLAADMAAAQTFDIKSKRDFSAMMDVLLPYKWAVSGKPYYNLWPRIIPKLLGMAFHRVTGHLFDESFGPMLLRMPMGEHGMYAKQGREVTSILITIERMDKTVRDLNDLLRVSNAIIPPADQRLYMHVMIYVLRPDRGNAWQGGNTFSFPLPQDDSYSLSNLINIGEDEIVNRRTASGYDPVTFRQSVRTLMNGIKLGVAAAMLERRELKLMQPADIIWDGYTDAQSHAIKCDPARLAALQPGSNGFDLGRDRTVNPHFRAGGDQHYWVGPGRKTRELRKRRWTIVHREEVEQMPSGHLLKVKIAKKERETEVKNCKEKEKE